MVIGKRIGKPGVSDAKGQCGQSKRRLACPWFKKDPLTHRECAKYKLQRMKDVKQHIYRRHTRRGGRGTDIQQENHIPKPEPKERAERKRQPGQNQIWDTIFLGEPHPRSPYLGNGQEELLALLRNFRNERQLEITASVLAASQLDIASHIIQHIMDSIFDRLEAELSSP
ncbi:hypothetical protein F4818DRAFT_374390 [Hypoxylon cercidicola]|nr:hypothetical protein F4818DRAFT_374390 [Hypoxylon cercidicola]